MKYFLRVIIVLSIAVAIVFGAYYYNNPDSNPDERANLTTVTKMPATEKNSDRTLLTSLKNEKIYLYQSNKSIILVHNGKETEFDNWNSSIGIQPPELYYTDFDSDGEKEIMVKAVNSINTDTNEYIYDLYCINPNPKGGYEVTVATRNTWTKVFDEMVTQEISQLESCNKIIQISMITGSHSIIYDAKTGIAKNGYSGYARALQNIDGDYLTLDNWSKGQGIYSIDKNNNINIDVEVVLSYKNTKATQIIGYIHLGLDFNNDNSFSVTPKSMVFRASEKYRVSSPKKVSSENWTYTETNTASVGTLPNDVVIDWVKYSFKYDSTIHTKSINYSSESTEMKNISKLVLTNNYIELTSKEGFSFGTGSAAKGEFSVIINEGTKNEYDIAYKASITKSDKNEVLRITFDKSYPKSEIKTIAINYGTK